MKRPTERPRRRYQEYLLLRKRFEANLGQLGQAGQQQTGDIERTAGG